MLMVTDMSSPDSLPFRATLEQYQRQAEALHEAWKAHDQSAEWRCKWMHPDFRGKSVAEVRAATLERVDAQVVIAREYSFENWTELAAFTQVIGQNNALTRFETAVEAVVSGEL